MTAFKAGSRVKCSGYGRKENTDHHAWFDGSVGVIHEKSEQYVFSVCVLVNDATYLFHRNQLEKLPDPREYWLELTYEDGVPHVLPCVHFDKPEIFEGELIRVREVLSE